ncbi:hypothetical protein TELCIR_17711, partial [Teladorsagia circumcincta]
FSDPDPLDTVSRTARVPPPKIYPTGTVRRTESFNSAPGVLAPPTYTLPRSCTTVPPPDPMSRLHDPLSARSHHDPLGRMGPRNVKWRTDVLASNTMGDDSDGATSAPEYAGSPSGYTRSMAQ